ncbi:MAG: uridine kinase [Chloroflexi bacterium]|nr:uridine kinase [Chloroflexota bacterium]
MAEQAGSRRQTVINALADAVLSIERGHPVRVAVDGWSCSGKTSIADELAAEVGARGRSIMRVHIDDFHCKGYRDRSHIGEWTPRLYWDEGYDYDIFRAWVLEPLGPGGDRRCRTDLRTTWNDQETPAVWHDIADNAVAIVDGTPLLHPLLASHWDYVIWLQVDIEMLVERACRRDGLWYGSREAAERRYRGFRQPGHELYERLAAPSRHAHAVVDNCNFESPRLLRVGQP